MTVKTTRNGEIVKVPPAINQDAVEHSQAIERLYDRAFGPGRFAKTAERLREGNTCLYALSRIAESHGEIIAAVRLWPLEVGGEGGVVLVGPVAVDAHWRGVAIGLELTQACLVAARDAGIKAALLIGSQPYFERIGFELLDPKRLEFPGHVPPERLLGMDLSQNTWSKLKGRVSVPRVAKPASSI